MQTAVQAKLIREKLKALVGIEFEQVANYILTVIDDPRYHATRISKDNGVDGIKFLNAKERSLYSSHAPTISAPWSAIKDKAKEDLKEAIVFAQNNKVIIKEWCVLLNRDLSGNQIEFFRQLCDENKIKKLRLVTLYEWEKIIYTHKIEDVVSRYLGLSEYRIPLHELQHHAAARELLTFLSELLYRPESERLEQLNAKEKEIIDLAFSSSNYTFNRTISLTDQIKTYTKINDNHILAYKYTRDGSFIALDKDGSELNGQDIFKDKNENIILTVSNLLILFLLIKALQAEVKNYSIDAALKRLFSVRRAYGYYTRNENGCIPVTNNRQVFKLPSENKLNTTRINQ